MKKRLSELTNLHILKRNTSLHADSCYLLSSESTAHSLYFETQRDIKFAHKQIKKHLSGIMDIVDYLFTPDGWALVVIVKSEEEIIDYCNEMEYNSITMKGAIDKKDISVILSECIRYTISSIARFINYKTRRKGTVVRENFSRCIFGDVDYAIETMGRMKAYEINLCEQRMRYVPKLKLWNDREELLGMDNIYMTTRRMREAMGREMKGEIIVSGCPKFHVLRKLINSTFKTNSPLRKSKKSPFNTKSPIFSQNL